MDNKLKNELLKSSNNGLDFFKIYFGDKLKWASKKRTRNLKNPFYPDKNGSLSIYEDDKGKWRFKDHGDPKYQGDCFDFYALVYNTNVKEGFQELLIVMKGVLQEGVSKLAKVKAFQNDAVLTERTITTVELNKIEFTDKALQFWKQYNITPEILLLNNVSQVIGYRKFYCDGEDKYVALTQDLIFSYKSGNFHKFYSPNPKKFWSSGKKILEYTFGLNYQQESNTIFLVGGEKDVMTLHALGYSAFCLSSETALPSRALIKELYMEQIEVVVLYDNDKAGNENAEKLSKKYSWQKADLSKIIDPALIDQVKDVSDYIKLKLPTERLKAFLNHFIDYSQDKETEEIQFSNISHTDDSQDLSPQKHNLIPERVYENLPESFKAIISKFDINRRDLVLVGALGVLSNIIKVQGVYDRKKVYPNLFMFVKAPASAGKSDLVWARKLGDAINKKFKDQYEQAYKLYQEDRKTNPKPNRKRLFISGNASYAALLQQLYNNGGEGIMFETEADTLSVALEAEWGNYSDLMRKSFEFEPIGKLRKNEEENIDIEKPRLSVLLSGTNDQLLKLIPTPENGLFSRFLFIELPISLKWRNPFGYMGDDEEYFSDLAKRFLKYYNFSRWVEIRFGITEKQINIFNRLFTTKQAHDNVMLGSEIIPSVRRMGAIHFRLAMLLATIRSLDNGSELNNLCCGDIDFETATILIKWFAKHTENIYNQLPKKKQQYPLSLKREIVEFHENLAKEFSSKDIIRVGESMGIAKSTYEAYIRKLISIQRVARYKQGLYRKIDNPNN